MIASPFEVDALVARIKPILAGHVPGVRSAVLADLVSISGAPGRPRQPLVRQDRGLGRANRTPVQKSRLLCSRRPTLTASEAARAPVAVKAPALPGRMQDANTIWIYAKMHVPLRVKRRALVPCGFGVIGAAALLGKGMRRHASWGFEDISAVRSLSGDRHTVSQAEGEPATVRVTEFFTHRCLARLTMKSMTHRFRRRELGFRMTKHLGDFGSLPRPLSEDLTQSSVKTRRTPGESLPTL